MQGADLALPLAQRSEAERMAYSEEDHEGNVLSSIRTPEWKLIEANRGNPRGLAPVELFAIDRDPGEKQNLEASQTERVAELRRRAQAERQLAASRAGPAAEQAKLSREECERLRVLGYVQSCDQVN